MTWEFAAADGPETYLLSNRYTSKTFQPESSPVDGSELVQKTVDGLSQQWEFIREGDGLYLIRLKGTGLYLAATSDENNSSPVLAGKFDSQVQRWKLVKQDSWC